MAPANVLLKRAVTLPQITRPTFR